jgi:hypothetical protein
MRFSGGLLACLRGLALAAAASVLPAGQAAGADFELAGSDELYIDTAYGQGTLRQNSAACVLYHGYVATAYAYDWAAMAVRGFREGPSPTSVGSACAYDHARVEIYGGGVGSLQTYAGAQATVSDGVVSDAQAFGSSAWNIAGGRVQSVATRDASRVFMSGGPVKSTATIGTWILDPAADWITGGPAGAQTFSIDFGDEHAISVDLHTGTDYSMNGVAVLINESAGYCAAKVITNGVTGLSTMRVSAQYGGPKSVDISSTQADVEEADFVEDWGLNSEGGGWVDLIDAGGSSRVDLAGGTIGELRARDNSLTSIWGEVTELGRGLSRNGREVVGTGTLCGLWLDGSDWRLHISTHDAGAVIRVIPEPTAVAMLVPGCLAMLAALRRIRGGPRTAGGRWRRR